MTSRFVFNLLVGLIFSATGLARAAVSGVHSTPNNSNERLVHDWAEHNFKSEVFSPAVSEFDRCAMLEQMSPERLMIFFEEIHSLRSKGIESCRPTLVRKITDYLNSKRTALRATYLTVARKNLRKCSSRVSPTFGPEIPTYVAIDQARAITGTYLPHCQVALTFDDGPHPVFGPQIVNILKAQDVHANFFQVGRNMAMYPTTTIREYKAGNVMGTHTWSHPDLQRMTPEQGEKQIEAAFDESMRLLHVYTPFFRFPYGAATPTLRAYLAHFSRISFWWNIDTLDWKIKDPEKLYQYALTQVDQVQRGIILMHEIHPQTVIMLPYLLDALRRAGYQPIVFRPGLKPTLQVHAI